MQRVESRVASNRAYRPRLERTRQGIINPCLMSSTSVMRTFGSMCEESARLGEQLDEKCHTKQAEAKHIPPGLEKQAVDLWSMDALQDWQPIGCVAPQSQERGGGVVICLPNARRERQLCTNCTPKMGCLPNLA